MKKQEYQLEEIGGNQFLDINEAKEAVLFCFTDCLVTSLNELLQAGALRVADGVILPARIGGAADGGRV